MNLPDQLTDIAERPKTWWADAPQNQRMIAAGGGAALLLALVVGIVTMSVGEDTWEPRILYAGLEFAEAAEVTTRLAQLGIPHKLTEDASTIVVPEDQVRELRLTLAAEGFPKRGRIGYEIFDGNQLAMTDFLQKVNLRRALQGELEETLVGIKGVRNARVHLVMPEPSLFTDEENPVTASVTLTLGGGTKLKARQIDAIAHLVSASVEGLEVENVVIVNSEGSMLSEETDPLTKAASRQFQQQQQVERALEKKVQTLMDEVIGKDRSKVRISVTLDFSRRSSSTTSFDPSATQVVVSEETSEKESAERGTEENAVRNYEVNRKVEDVIGSVGTIARLSMALTVDETKVVIDPDTGDLGVEPRPQEEIDNLAQLARRAVGFDLSRGDEIEVFPMPFDKTQEIEARRRVQSDASREWWTDVAVNVAKVLGILAALITLRFIIQAIGRGVGVEEDLEVLGEVAGDVEEEEFERVETPHDIILSRVQTMVRERPEDAAKLIKTMVVEDLT